MSDLDKILELIDDDEVIDLTQRLVRIPSISGEEGNEIRDFITDYFNNMDIPVRHSEVKEGRTNLFCDLTFNEPGPKLLFNGHNDTKWVEGMTVDPFAAEIRDGKMYGRGTCDMKAGLAAVFSAFKAVKKSGISLKGSATLFSDIDEESGGKYGWVWVRERGLLDGFDVCVCCEPTDLEICLGNKGVIATSFISHGRSAHSGMAELGQNAVHDMTLFIQEYLKLPYLKKTNPFFGQSTVNFERIEGHLYIAAVPDKCRAWLDTRLIPETPPELVRTEFNGLIERLKAKHSVDIVESREPSKWREQLAERPACVVTENEPVVLAAQKAHNALTGKTAALSSVSGVTFASLAAEIGFPCIIMGPGSIRQAHTEDEWIEVSQIPLAARLYAAMIVELLGN